MWHSSCLDGAFHSGWLFIDRLGTVPQMLCLGMTEVLATATHGSQSPSHAIPSFDRPLTMFNMTSSSVHLGLIVVLIWGFPNVVTTYQTSGDPWWLVITSSTYDSPSRVGLPGNLQRLLQRWHVRQMCQGLNRWRWLLVQRERWWRSMMIRIDEDLDNV